ncbi:hypothetical protein IMSHALPRED_003281 [Imshaugia aleurites]|uniref:Uncharacterized protein n=1 Tax=Imshaugia aleurites TaxID=172621 RepID=A0A8H3F3Y7_9LECA|nr:hypothetical protein IMSHALPRED_003281 [Imshaugia aleurites]
MCTTKLSKHPKCGHWSCEIKDPCKEGRDFSNCRSFTNGVARKWNSAKYPQEMAKEKTCPKCDKEDDYDGKKIRMVKKSVHATKVGCGPSRSDWGFNLGKKSHTFQSKKKPKKEQSTMSLTEGGCVMM